MKNKTKGNKMKERRDFVYSVHLPVVLVPLGRFVKILLQIKRFSKRKEEKNRGFA